MVQTGWCRQEWDKSTRLLTNYSRSQLKVFVWLVWFFVHGNFWNHWNITTFCAPKAPLFHDSMFSFFFLRSPKRNHVFTSCASSSFSQASFLWSHFYGQRYFPVCLLISMTYLSFSTDFNRATFWGPLELWSILQTFELQILRTQEYPEFSSTSGTKSGN